MIIFSLVIISLGSLIYFKRHYVYYKLGCLLVHEDVIEKPASLIVVLRGGAQFERLLEGYELYREGMGEKILILRSLSDVLPKELEQRKISIQTGQQKFKQVLMDLNVLDSDIILDSQKPGGGTYGEALRVRNFVEDSQGIKSILVVTSWHHTKRAGLIYDKVFDGSPVKVYMHPALKYSVSIPSNWWKYRYQAQSVVLEIMKNMYYVLFGNRTDFENDKAGRI